MTTMMDYSLQKKPVFLYASDLDLYLDDRGFYHDYKKLPYSYAVNNDELESNIMHFNKKDYELELEKFFKSIGSKESGNASKTIASIISSKIDGGKNGR